MSGFLSTSYCQGDPCWCGAHREPVRDPQFKPWSQEGEDRFFAERKAERARRATKRAASPTGEARDASAGPAPEGGA